MHARKLVAIALFAAATSSPAVEAAIPIVELGSGTQSEEGFHVKLDVVSFPPRHDPGAVPLITFVAEVPREVGRTSLGIVWLELEGRQGQTLLDTPMDRRVRGKIVRCSVDVERRLAQDCVLHFHYAPTGQPGRWVKDYVLRLKYHLAPTQ